MVQVDNPLIDFADAHPLLGFVLFGIVLFVLISGGVGSVQSLKAPADLPWVGVQDGQLFGLTRAAFASVQQGREWLAKAYLKVAISGSRKVRSHANVDISVLSTRQGLYLP